MFSSIILNVHSVRSFWSFLCSNLILPLDRHYGYSIVTIAGSFYNAPFIFIIQDDVNLPKVRRTMQVIKKYG